MRIVPMRLLASFSLTSTVFAVFLGLPLVSAPSLAQGGTVTTNAEMRTGDRIILSVEGEKALTDSFTVATGPSLELPLVGIISLVGVRRADLESVLKKAIGRYVKNPVVRAKILAETIRLAVVGEIVKPGFYELPREATLGEVVMKAGGPVPNTKLNRMRIERSDTTLLAADAVRKAVDAGATLTQLGLQSGDRVILPATGGFTRSLQLIGAIIAIPLTILYLTSFRR
jgi:protein involved in polysaccharide export with SLBB domain